MRGLTNIIGIILIIIGILTLAYEGFTYTKHEKVAEIGNLQVTEDTTKTVYFSPWLGGLSFVAGIVLVVISRKKMS